MADCVVDPTHCASCGQVLDLMQGSISPCCQARITRGATCDGGHPVVLIQQADPTQLEVDNVVGGYIADLARGLVAAGREKATAVADIERAVASLRTIWGLD
jgi:hypothetical protein